MNNEMQQRWRAIYEKLEENTGKMDEFEIWLPWSDVFVLNAWFEEAAPLLGLPDDVAQTLESALLFWLEQSEQAARIYVGAEEDLPAIKAQIEVASKWVHDQLTGGAA